VRCLEVKDTGTLDRLFWCEQCRAKAMRRSARVGWLIGGVLTALLAVWIFTAVQPTRLLGGWIGILAAAFYLTARMVREIGYGAMRLMNRRAVEAVPPSNLPEQREQRPEDEV